MKLLNTRKAVLKSKKTLWSLFMDMVLFEEFNFCSRKFFKSKKKTSPVIV